MIDTIILNVPRDQIKHLVADGNFIAPWDLHSKTPNYAKYVKNPTPNDRRSGSYKPRLTGVKRRVRGNQYNSFLKIEFSVPKLLFGNNLDEILETDFERVISTLRESLVDSGVIISGSDLKKAMVTTVHFGKNIPLKDGYTASYITKELSKININKKFDLNNTNFRNDGQSLQGYTMAHSIVFYDKLSDLAKTKKRAIDKDQTANQLSLFSDIKSESPELEVLRFEVRLCQRQKLNGVLTKNGFSSNPTFEDIFKKEIWQKILIFYWESVIEDKNLFLFGKDRDPKELLQDLLDTYPNSGIKESIYLVGLDSLCKTSGGIRDLRSILEAKSTQRSWYRINDGIKKLNKGFRKRNLLDWVKQIEESLEKFESHRLKSRAP